MKQILIIISAISTLAVTAQNNFIFPDSLNQIFMNTKGGIASSSIPQKFMNKFIFPGFIDNQLKDAASNNLKNKNFLGASVSGDFNLLFSERKDTSKTSRLFGIGFGTELQVNTSFTRDLFNLTFYGNKPFNGETLNLNNTNFNSLAYSYLEYSLGKSIVNNDIKTSFWGDFGLLLGHSFTDINFEQASLFTEENGDYLELTLSESSIVLSDTTSNSLVQGIGAKIDLFYSRQSPNSVLLISAENIGGIFWQNALSANIDTIFNFEGIETGDIFQLSDSVLNEVETFDSIISTARKDVFKTIPVELSGYYRKSLNLFYFDVLMRHRLFSNYTPYLRAGLNFNLRNIKPGITTSYGGYSTFNFGINTDVDLFNTLKIQVGTNNILGSILPNSTSALDVYLGLRLKFN